MTASSASVADDPLEFLNRRRSVPSRLLADPAPQPEQLQRWLAAAVRVPDHGKLTPWRFLLLRGDARLALGRLLERTLLEDTPDASTAARDKERQRFSHAPLVVTVVGRILEGHRIPACEQLLSCGCVCYSLLLAAEAEGFGAQWLTGWAAYDRRIAAALGLQDDETVVGFIHIGTPRERIAERERPDPATLISEWRG